MPSRLWSLGVLLVALGIAAHVVGWGTLLWLPMRVLDALWWVPMTVADAVSSAPAATGVIVLGVVLLVIARVWGRHKDRADAARPQRQPPQR